MRGARRAGCAAESAAGAVPPAAPRISHEVGLETVGGGECGASPAAMTHEVGECNGERAVSFVDFVWRARRWLGRRTRRVGRGPRICFLLPECHMKLVNVAGNKLCLLLTSCGGGACLRVEGGCATCGARGPRRWLGCRRRRGARAEAVAEASNAARAARAIATRARPWAP